MPGSYGVSDVTTAATVLLLTSPEAAKALAVSPRTLWSLTQSGAIPCVRIGRAVRYSPDDLRAWVEAQKTAGTCSKKTEIGLEVHQRCG